MASACATPFVDESLFPNAGGAVASRWCEQMGNASCCLPCPFSSWRWEDVTRLVDDWKVALWPSILVLILLVWSLVTFAIFPAHITGRHYLSTSPLIGFVFITIAFIIPSRGQPKECYNEITPNPMRNDARCAAMGVCLFFGAWVVISSCFFRSVALHLSVCWESQLGRQFQISSLAIIFLGSAALVAIALTVSGVQYTWGRICYLIPHYDRASFWGPLLGVSIASLILQFITMIYCLTVIIQPYLDYQKRRWYGGGPSLNGAHMINTPRTASRARKILQMQWRAIMITVLIVVYVVYLASVLMRMRRFHQYPREARRKWFKCLASAEGDKMACLHLAEELGPSEPDLWATLYMLILAGLLGVIILFHPAMLRAWADLLTGKKRLSWGNNSGGVVTSHESHGLVPGTKHAPIARRGSCQERIQSRISESDVETARSDIGVAISHSQK